MKAKELSTVTYDGPIWEGIYDSFSEVLVEGSGFDGTIWIDNSLKKISASRDEAKKNAPLPPTSNYREVFLPLLARMVYNEKKQLRVLDFGGGIGFTYFQTIFSLPATSGVEYHIVERYSTCQAGRQFFGTEYDNLFFQSHLPQAKGSFDIVHSSSALQYIEDWKKLISQLCELSSKYLLLVDIPIGNIPTFVAAQNYYGSKIPTRFFNINEFFSFINLCGYELIFSAAYRPTILGVEQDLPMQNYDENYRLKQACNLLFVKIIVASEG